MISAINVTTTAAVVIPANVSRTGVLIQNVSDTDIYLKMDGSETALTAANGFKVSAGQSFGFTTTPPVGYESVWAIHGGSGNKEIRLQEFTRV